MCNYGQKLSFSHRVNRIAKKQRLSNSNCYIIEAIEGTAYWPYTNKLVWKVEHLIYFARV